MIVCKNCGHENPDSVAFCELCSAFLEWSGEHVTTGADGADAPPGTGAGSGSGSQTAAAGAGATGAATGGAAGRGPTAATTGSGTASADASGGGKPAGGGPGPAVDWVATPVGTIVCPRCGAANESGRAFCSHCGASLQGPKPAAGTTDSARTTRRGLAAGGLPSGALPVAAGLVIALVVGIVALTQLGGASTGSPRATGTVAPTSGSGGPVASGAGSSSGTGTGSSAEPSTAGGSPSPAIAAASNDTVVFYAVRNGNPDVFRVARDGQGLRQLTTADGADSDPAWSPDRTRIAFESHAPSAGLPSGFAQIWVMNADGSDPHPLTSAAANSAHATWSPDGSRIAFDSDRSGGTWQVYVMNADGSSERTITTLAGGGRLPAWSSTNRIAFDATVGGQTQIWVVDPQGKTAPKRLISGMAAFPAWSPDGSRLAFASTRLGGRYQVFVARIPGGTARAITGDLERAINPAWSPDGTEIVYEGTVAGRSHLFIVPADGGKSLIALLPSMADAHRPAWR